MRVISALVHEANQVAHGKEHGAEKDLYLSSNGAQVEFALRFAFLIMYDILINIRFPNNHSFNEKHMLVRS